MRLIPVCRQCRVQEEKIMTASNGSIPSEGEKNFFTAMQPFPDVIDGKIDTVDFLQSSKGVVSLVEQFGKAFAPIKYDISGNIDKLTKVFERDPELNKYLNDMILHEKSEGGNYAIDALLWLKRALQFVQAFFQSIVDDEERTEDLVPFLKKAYQDVLQRYHGWMVQQLFHLICRTSPSRSDFLRTLALGLNDREDNVIRDMSKFLERLSANIVLLNFLYTMHNLDSDKKV